MSENDTLLNKLRLKYEPRVPNILKNLNKLKYTKGEKTESIANQKQIKDLFPNTYGSPIVDIEENSEECKSNPILNIGVVLSGGQASGGHNVIIGLFDALKTLNKDSQLIGFLNGPAGIMKNNFRKLTKDFVDKYRNTGGFDMIASGRDKIESLDQMKSALNTVNSNKLDGLVVIGGDDSNTNAAVLGEFFTANKSKCVVVGVPKTIDGDLQNEYIEMSFGFDTAVRSYSEMISNICRDSKSARKAWHFIKLMGRDASQVTLDCAIQTHPNITLIGEEIQKENLLLHDVTEKMVDVIIRRYKQDKNYGVILIPEGIISFIPSMKALISKLNHMLKVGSEHLQNIEKLNEMSEKIKYIREELRKESLTNLQNFDVLPKDIQVQLLLERDPHGNIQMSQVPTEQLFILIVQKKLKERKEEYKGKFRGIGHFFGYDGRSGFPTNFDANYCNALGRTATLLIQQKLNGYMSRVYNLENDVSEWKCGGIPISMLLNMEVRHGKPKPVIRKCLVDVDKGEKFYYFNKRRYDWEINDDYRYVGPIQFFGPKELTDIPPYNVLLKKTGDIKWPVDKKSNN